MLIDHVNSFQQEVYKRRLARVASALLLLGMVLGFHGLLR
jgi:hypothetical protein